jgi:hypothetical protein
MKLFDLPTATDHPSNSMKIKGKQQQCDSTTENTTIDTVLGHQGIYSLQGRALSNTHRHYVKHSGGFFHVANRLKKDMECGWRAPAFHNPEDFIVYVIEKNRFAVNILGR